jgi:hypothetical protein
MAEVIVTSTPNNYDPSKDAWKWVVNRYYEDGRKAFGTVHRDDVSKDIEVRVAASWPKIARIVVLTWREAGRPCPQYGSRE